MMKTLLSRLAPWAMTTAVITAATLVAIWMWTQYERSAWTRDGRVRADVVRVAPDVNGFVATVEVHDNQPVTKGDILFTIDQARYSIALDRANAAVAGARATLAQALRNTSRDAALGEVVAKEALEQSQTTVDTAQAALDTALVAQREANLNLERTRVRASVNGMVTNLDLHPGDYVAPGQQAIALVDSDTLRVEGYFEETKLPLIRIGAPAVIRLMGEDAVLNGRVESISAGINDSTRSDSSDLLPNIEPNFSWVRLAQRIPVRISIEPPRSNVRLIVGRTATIAIQPAGARRQ